MALRKKIMVAIIILVFIPVTVMGVFSYVYFSSAMERKTSDFYYSSLIETDRKLNYAMAEINGITDLSITQPLIQQYLKRHLDRSAQGDPMGERQLTADLNNLLLSHPKINSLSLYSNNGLLHASSGDVKLSLDDLKQQPWYTRMTALLGRPLWLGPYENPALGDNPMQLTHVRVIKDYYTLENIGVLMLTVKTDMLENLFWETSMLSQGDILLVNGDGTILFSKSGQYVGKKTAFPFLQKADGKPTESYTGQFEGAEMFITHVPSVIEGWHLVALTQTDELLAESRNVRNIALSLLVLSLLSALLFDVAFVARLVKSISLVVKGMRQVEIGRFTEIDPARLGMKDESGLLLKGFNRMSRQIGELIARVEVEQTRKKEAEMQALVAQINPHFIYNSLESINSMAVLQGNREISRMVVSLGKLLRISISENQELIPLATEMEHVKHYLLIQKFRFEDKLDYELHVQEHLKHCACMRLIIQPLVENALYHGIEKMREKGIISIRAFEENGYLIIEVADNGLGMSQDRLGELFGKPLQGASKHSHEGVGLRNVHERIRIRFGEPYGIMVCSAYKEGTIVRVRIPLFAPVDTDAGNWKGDDDR